jgi:hypothetical protein
VQALDFAWSLKLNVARPESLYKFRRLTTQEILQPPKIAFIAPGVFQHFPSVNYELIQLIIGINDYTSKQKIREAVFDVDADFSSHTPPIRGDHRISRGRNARASKN